MNTRSIALVMHFRLRKKLPLVLSRLQFSALLLLVAPTLPAQVTTFGSSSRDRAFSVAYDDAGNIFYSGTFQGTVDFDPSDAPDAADTLTTSPGATDGFVSSFAPDGSLRFLIPLQGGGLTSPYTVALGVAGDVFVTGAFDSTVDFDPGPAVVNRTGDASADVFLAKYTNSGEFLAVTTVTGSRRSVALDLTLDGADNAYIMGTFEGTQDFDPGPGATQLVATGFRSGFVASYSPSGDFRFARKLTAQSSISLLYMATDPEGNSFVGGSFRGELDLDDSDGPDAADSPPEIGSGDIFIASYAADGAFRFGHSIGGEQSDSAGGIAVDGSGNVYLTGEVNPGADFDPGPGVVEPLGTTGGFFLSSYTGAGSFRFAVSQTFGANGEGSVVAADGDDVYVAGKFRGGVMNIAPNTPGGLGAISAVGGNAFTEADIFIARFKSDGTCMWARSCDTQNASAFYIAADGVGGVAVAGQFPGTADFDPGIEEDSRTSAGDRDAFVLQLNEHGLLPGSPEESFVVTNTNDSGPGSLRRAMRFASNAPDRNTITFEIPGVGPHVIAPLSPLPSIDFPVILDGLSQAGADASSWPSQLNVVVNGSSAGVDADGITVGPPSSGFGEPFADPTLVRGLVVQNFIGHGVRIFSAADRVTLSDCFIGTSADGLSAAPNQAGGIIAIGSEESSNRIGVAAGETTGRNLISGNGGPGIQILATKGFLIQNNHIGVGSTGAALGNAGTGVLVSGATTPENVLIGGTSAGLSNLIAHNTEAGVTLGDSIGIEILGNSIHSNGSLGIDHFSTLFDAGLGEPESNDTADLDDPFEGANRGMNSPVLDTAIVDGGVLTVSGTLDAARSNQRVEFFSSPVANESGFGEGTVFLGAINTNTERGVAWFAVEFPPVPVGQVITATATHRRTPTSGDGTSEFSNAVGVVAATVTNVADSGAGSLRSVITAANASPGAENIFISPALKEQTLVLLSDLPVIEGGMSIVAPSGFSISGGNARRLFEIAAPDATVTLANLTIAAGAAELGGGILHSHGTLNLERCTVSGCSSTGDGGGIALAGGMLNLEDTRITGNSAAGNGGGIACLGGHLDCYRVTIDNNIAFGTGGGVHSNAITGLGTSRPSVEFHAATFSQNEAATGGGIFCAGGFDLSFGRARLDFCTVAENLASVSGGGVAGSVELDYCVAALNTAPLDADYAGSARGESTIGGDPLLGPLRDNGGFVPTHALLTGSPAIGASRQPQGQNLGQRKDARLAPRVTPASGGDVDHGAFEFFEEALIGSGEIEVALEFRPSTGWVGTYSRGFLPEGTMLVPEVSADLSNWVSLSSAMEVGSTLSRIDYEVLLTTGSTEEYLRIRSFTE